MALPRASKRSPRPTEGCGDEEAARPTGVRRRGKIRTRAPRARGPEASGEEGQEEDRDDGGAEAGEAESFAGEEVEIGVKHVSHRLCSLSDPECSVNVLQPDVGVKPEREQMRNFQLTY